MNQVHLSKLSELRIDADQRATGSSSWPKVLLVLVLLAGGAIGVLFWQQPKASAEFGGQLLNTIKSFRTPEVSLTHVELRKPGGNPGANGLLTASGYVIARRKAAVSARAAGLLVVMNADVGDFVKRDQEIGHLEQSREEAQLKSAEARLEGALAGLAGEKTELANAQKVLERQKQLRQQGIATQQAFDDAEARVDQSRARIRALEAEILTARTTVDAAKVELEYTVVRAPFDGRILTKDAEIGEMVAPAFGSGSTRGSIVTMANFSELEVEVDVSEAYISRIRPDLPAQIVIDAYPDKTYKGKTRQIVPTANRQKASVLAKISILDADEKILPEMGAKVTFLESDPPTPTPEELKSYLVVDSRAIHQGPNGSFVFSYQNGSIVDKSVILGRVSGQEVEVLGGLIEGEVVVLEGPVELATGMKVKVLDGSGT